MYARDFKVSIRVTAAVLKKRSFRPPWGFQCQACFLFPLSACATSLGLRLLRAAIYEPAAHLGTFPTDQRIAVEPIRDTLKTVLSCSRLPVTTPRDTITTQIATGSYLPFCTHLYYNTNAIAPPYHHFLRREIRLLQTSS